MTWVSVAVAVGTSLAAAGVSAYSQHQTAKKQDNQLAAQLRHQNETEQKVAARNAQLVQQQNQQTDQPQKTAAQQQYQKALQANQQNANQPLNQVGNVSDAYKKAGSDAALGIASYGSNLGNLTASIDAPGQQRRDNQKNIDNYGLDVNQLNRGQKGQDFLDQLKLNGIHGNPYVGLLTGVASAYARAKMGAGGGSSGFSGFDSQPAGSTDYSGYA